MKSTDYTGPPALSNNTAPSNGSFKENIVLFDTIAGTKAWVAPFTGTVRVAIHGGAGGVNISSGIASSSTGGYEEKVYSVTQGTSYPYVVGAAGTCNSGTPTAGGTSSFNGDISATGAGPNGGTPGVGSNGLVSRTGGQGLTGGTLGGGASAAHRFGNGQPAGSSDGAGFSSPGGNAPGVSAVDGWGIGLNPNACAVAAENYFVGSTTASQSLFGVAGYGFGGRSGAVTTGGSGGGQFPGEGGGLGGGGGQACPAAVAGGCGSNGLQTGCGFVLIERLS